MKTIITVTAALMASSALAQGVATTASSGGGASAGAGAGVSSSGLVAGGDASTGGTGILDTNVVADPGEGGLAGDTGPGSAGIGADGVADGLGADGVGADGLGADGSITDISDLPFGAGSGIDEEAVLDDGGAFGVERGPYGADGGLDLGEADDPDTDFWEGADGGFGEGLDGDRLDGDGLTDLNGDGLAGDGLSGDRGLLGDRDPGDTVDGAVGEALPVIDAPAVGDVKPDGDDVGDPSVVQADSPVLVVPGRGDGADDAGLATEDETTPLTGGVGGDVEPKMIEVGDDQ